MKVISVNVGRPLPLSWEGRVVLSGIFKNPVQGPVHMQKLNLDGDEQADPTVHGGIHKAVYAYPSEHYNFWREYYPTRSLEPGAFGENLTTEGLLESATNVGDKVQIGSVILTVVQPRQPCFKLAAKFHDVHILRKFAESGRSGIYFSVDHEGELQSGDDIRWVHRDPNRFAITDCLALLYGGELPTEMLQRALQVKVLPDSWRRRVAEALAPFS